jgi:DNA-binding LacI/PurR family transcriptional regulator
MNERAVFGILGGLAGRGLTVPDDVSVVSMVTSPQVAELATPALTAMTSPGSALGRIAVEALLRHLELDSAPIHQELLPCTLEVRGSSGPPGRPTGDTTGTVDAADPEASGTTSRNTARRRAATRRRA